MSCHCAKRVKSAVLRRTEEPGELRHRQTGRSDHTCTVNTTDVPSCFVLPLASPDSRLCALWIYAVHTASRRAGSRSCVEPEFELSEGLQQMLPLAVCPVRCLVWLFIRLSTELSIL